MKALLTCQRVLTWFCVYPVDETTNRLKIIASILFTIVTFMGNLSTIIVSTAFLLKYARYDFEQSLYAVFQLGALFSWTNINIVILMKSREIAKIFVNLQKIYEESKNFEDIFFHQNNF